MDHESLFGFKNNSLLWLIVLVFASVLTIQHFDVSYGVGLWQFFSDTSPDNVSGLANFSAELDKNCSYSVNYSSAGVVTRKDGFETQKSSDFELQFMEQAADCTSGGASNLEETGESNFSNIIASSYAALPPKSKVLSYQDATASGSGSGSGVKNVVSGQKKSHFGSSAENFSLSPTVAAEKTWIKGSVVSIRELNQMFLRHSSYFPNLKKLWSSAGDQQLLNAKNQIEKVTIGKDDSGLYAPLYWNISRFRRSYEIMEQTLKIYVYNEGERPVFHQPRLTGIYASEGWFMKLLQESKQYVTTNPLEAHLYYLPFSSQRLEEALYVPNSHSFDPLKQYLKNYLDTIKGRYPFWNRTSGTDHFLVACHDWAPEETRVMMANCIRALCNADMGEGFQLGKDVSLPETYMQSSKFSSLGRALGGKPASQRRILAFFAGKMHGYVRPIMLKHWENKDPDMKIVGRLRKASYIEHMKSSKYCICAKGYEVNSPRLVEAIMYGCVPVILSDNFVPPFLEVLNWEKFAIFVLEKDIPNLKNILLSISDRRYLVMQQRVNQVRKHFLWHNVPLKYDIFHMILHSIWYNRVFNSR